MTKGRRGLGGFLADFLRGSREGLAAFLFLAPAIAMVLVLRILPSTQAIIDSVRLPMAVSALAISPSFSTIRAFRIR